MTINDTPTPTTTPLERLRQVMANADHLDEDSNIQAVFLVQNAHLFGEVLAQAVRQVGRMPEAELTVATNYLVNF